MNRVAVYTAIFGEKDQLKDPLNFAINNHGVDYFCFSDNPNLQSSVYKVVYKNPQLEDAVRKSRFFKINGTEELAGYDYLIWHDGNIQIDSEQIQSLIEDLGSNFLAAFAHPHRDNVFDESKACIRRNKDKFSSIAVQLLHYMRNGVNTKSRLYETGILVRRSNVNKEFYHFWWNDVERYSSRDQLSLGYLVEKSNVNLSLLKGCGNTNPYSKYHTHLSRTPVQGSTFLRIKVFFLSFSSISSSRCKKKEIARRQLFCQECLDNRFRIKSASTLNYFIPFQFRMINFLDN